MKYGIFGTLSTESESVDDAKFEENVMVEVSDEADYTEVCDMVASSESEYLSMEQATAVASKLDVQHELTGEMLEHPEEVTAGAVAMARESMDLALAVLGGRPSTEYAVSNESMVSSPLHALQVTHEGIGKTSKRIYEGIKMLFKRIALTIKKMAAKLVVMLNRTGKKAEKMLKAFKADKTSNATKSKLEDSDATKIIDRTGGVRALKKNNDSFGATAVEVYKTLAVNMKMVKDVNSAYATGVSELKDAVIKHNSTATENDKINSLTDVTTNKLNAISTNKVLLELVDTGKLNITKFVGHINNEAKNLDIANRLDDLSLTDEYVDAPVFYPTYTKGNKIHGVVFYKKKVESGEDNTVVDILNSFKWTNASVSGILDGELENEKKVMTVKSREDISTDLTSLKPASTQLKTFADARQRDIETVVKEINKLAKDSGVKTIFKSYESKQATRTRMFVAGNYVASIFAMASTMRAELAEAAMHVSYYEDAWFRNISMVLEHLGALVPFLP